jgi:hypothetical protein
VLTFFSFVVRLVIGLQCAWGLTGCSVKHLAEVVSVDSPVFIESLNIKPLPVKQEFVVALTTLAGGCTRPGKTRVEISGLRAEIHPYNRTPLSLWGQWCDLVIRAYPRQVRLRFDSPGVAIIRVIGRGSQGESQLIERHVEVR